jgi:GT2 family glycosyltransferase
MQLSVIILNFNVRYFLEQCVLSVQKALEGIEGEIIIVDNNSSDDSCAMMHERFPQIKLLQNKENVGFPKGNNIGVAQARGEYICILNPDTVVAEDTFTKVLAFAKTKTNLGIVGCKLIDGTGNFLPESKRGIPTPWVAFTKIFGLYKVFPKNKWFNQYYAQHISENETGKVEILVGAFMVMQRNLYNEIGGFDENCFMYSDDIDLSYMVLKKGKSNYYLHETTVIHYKGESTIRDGKYMKRFQEAMNFFYKKHFNKSVIFDIFMKMGSVVFLFFKKQQQKNSTRVIDKYVFFTKEKTNLNLSKPLDYYADFNSFYDSSAVNFEIIFDAKSFKNKEIIGFMSTFKSKNITFKNYIDGTNFLVGSNNANDIGQIIICEN